MQPKINTVKKNKTAMSEIPYRSLPIRLLNKMGSVLERFGISPANRSEESLMAVASRKTGLSDWGDGSFRPALRTLLESYRKDAKLNFFGWLDIHEMMIIRHLINRLLIQDELKRHPEILQEQIRQPLFIVSLPRTGTSMLQWLLSQDPSNRSLLFWEALSPAPPPEPETFETDPRIAEAEKTVRKYNKLDPKLSSIHHTQAQRPHECFRLLMNSFTYSFFQVTANVTQYSKWVKDQDMLPVYQYYRQQLQLLQSRFPTERWVLKAPWHMYYIDELLTTFPDARVVQTHRDPSKAIPSLCSLITISRGLFSDHVDPHHIGKEFLRELEIMIERSSQARDNFDSSRFFDIHYNDLVQDPTGTVLRIYEHFGYRIDGDFEKRMHEWLTANPRHKKGVHHYSLEQFGLDADMVNHRFRAYRERFGIPSEL
ncbi:MAG: sulfotransferase [Desulfobacterales bacterium]|nr:sulfotransferase [Desulfobacterales bacterium]